MLGQSFQHFVTAMFVNAMKLRNLLVEATRCHVVDGNLVNRRRMQISCLLHQDQLADHRLRGNHVANAQTRRQRLGE
ncbi:hypothetical protein D9M69_641180 [compost metagenome]